MVSNADRRRGAVTCTHAQAVNALRPDRSDVTVAKLWCDAVQHGYRAMCVVDGLATLELLPEAMAQVTTLLASERRATAAAAARSLRLLWSHALPTDIAQRLVATATAQNLSLPTMLVSIGEAAQKTLSYAYQQHWDESLGVIKVAFTVRARNVR